jgi:hypothetical protein
LKEGLGADAVPVGERFEINEKRVPLIETGLKHLSAVFTIADAGVKFRKEPRRNISLLTLQAAPWRPCATAPPLPGMS